MSLINKLVLTSFVCVGDVIAVAEAEVELGRASAWFDVGLWIPTKAMRVIVVDKVEGFLEWTRYWIASLCKRHGIENVNHLRTRHIITWQ